MATVEKPSNATREPRTVALEELRQLWRDGVESGQSVPLEPEDVKRRGRDAWRAGANRAKHRFRSVRT